MSEKDEIKWYFDTDDNYSADAAKYQNANSGFGAHKYKVKPFVDYEKYIYLQSENALLKKKLNKAVEGLKFYRQRNHMKMSEEVNCSGIIYDYERLEWKIGPPYIIGVEFGQVAYKTLKELEEMK